MACTKIIIFGASGDLTKRKLMPALYKVKSLDFEIIGYSRSDLKDTFKDHISKFNVYDEEFLQRVKYISGQYEDLSGLKEYITDKTICYLSVPPSLYLCLITQLLSLKVRKICLEKPFGEDLQCFMQIYALQKENKESNLFFIDHYLYKPMTVAIPVFYKKYEIFKEILQNRYLDSVQIYFKEQLGSEGRAYFEKTGLVKDVIQNHVGEILSTVANTNVVTRTDLLSKANIVHPNECLFGQYDEYKKEVMSQSETETFAMMTITFLEKGWENIPFVVIAGKGMDEKRVECRFEFTESGSKKLIDLLSLINPSEVEEYKHFLKNNSFDNTSLVFNYSPENEVYLEIKLEDEYKKILIFDEQSVLEIMKSKYNDLTDHEIVFDGIIQGKDIGDAKCKEVEYLWRIFDPKLMDLTNKFITYPKGIDLPKEANDLLRKIIKTYRKKR
ncbi:glucose-6-phosphate 1-dehydrogenase [Tubulinosema ratisbonensis]|uniref:Glucose-6-phosphate 1-dehydrogenase n=1 Tax=Tubulinosema ratisbonensis TaxID=291195 RepID=A0A437APK2_9MICR|nr:glucose-6-phosphate 1-dehydrogenase [Tubulinosema ratisbonensis]